MIISKGKQYDSSMQDVLLEQMAHEINETLAVKTLPQELVVAAISELGAKVARGEFDDLIEKLPVDGKEHYKQLAVTLLSRENLEFKIKTELGEDFRPSYVTDPPLGLSKLRVTAMPLGVILHIAAGNVDGLPAFSLAEGLLTGNINILKLPGADNGLSLQIIGALIDIEPALADFIYVFDTPSTDVQAIKKMADLSDGIAVWGGDAAIAAVRRFAAPGTRIIEWGHKLSFAYISGYSEKERELDALAHHIMETGQLLCSSCQTIFIDTDRMEDVYDFCRDFLPHLEHTAAAHRPSSIGARAELTLRQYTARLESVLQKKNETDTKVFRGVGCSLIPRADSELELSDMFGSCPVKRLPERDLLPSLRLKKGYLQTAGLICSDEKRAYLTELLAKSGVVRITGAGEMSSFFAGEAHDGEYPLRRYLRIVNAN